MRILHLSTSQHAGGAAIAAYRLHRALLANSIQSELLVANRQNNEPFIVGPTSLSHRIQQQLRTRIEQLPTRFRLSPPTTPFSINWTPKSFAKNIERIQPDIIHLHWVSGGLLAIEELARLKRPIVWTLHDCWPFTGGCHIIYDCNAFAGRCGKCPQLNSSRSFDLSRLTWLRKQRAWRNLPMTIVAPSQWMAEQAKASSLLGDKPIHVIPNGLDTSLFKPFDQSDARDIWGLPQDRRLILFGAMSSTEDLVKGYDLLQLAIKQFRNRLLEEQCEFVVFGNHDGRYVSKGPSGEVIHFLGQIREERSLRLLYSSADLMVVPSRQESFGQTVSESLACGTPVVAFDTSGPRDIVDHQTNGYLATPYSPNDFADGMAWTLAELERGSQLKQQARAKAVRAFDGAKVAREHQLIYEEILAQL